MKQKTAGITRRGLGRLLGAVALPPAGAAERAKARARRQGALSERMRRAREKVRSARPGGNISPAFRFIP